MITHPVVLGIAVAASLLSIAGAHAAKSESQMTALASFILVAAIAAAISVWP
jgi:hypothetical protein